MFAKGQRYFIDSNIFLYAAAEPSVLKQSCLKLLEKLAEQGGIAVTNCLVLEEVHFIYYRQTRKTKECLKVLKNILSGLGDLFAVTPSIVTLALKLFASTPVALMSVKDYYHVASALHHGIGSIVSSDADYDRFKGIKRIDPTAI